MSRQTILVIASRVQHGLLDTLSAEGKMPIVTCELSAFVEKLRKNHISAVVVDSEHTGTDALEVVLTARDINPRVPILVLGTSLDAASASALQQYPDVRLVAKAESTLKVHHELARMTHTMEHAP